MKNEKKFLTLFRMGGGGKKIPPRPTPSIFFPVTSNNVRTSPQNFLTFSCNPFGTSVWNFKFAPSASAELLNLNQDHPSKKQFFGQILLKLGSS